MLQFNNELNNTSARLAEEVEASANTAEQHSKAVEQTRDMARALALTVSACQKQKIVQKLLKRKLEDQARIAAKVSKDRDVAHAQVLTSGSLLKSMPFPVHNSYLSLIRC